MATKLSKNINRISQFISEKKTQLYKIEDIEFLLNELKHNNWIGVRTTVEDLLTAIKPYRIFSNEYFEKSDFSKSIMRYTTGKINDLLLIDSLASECFFSHQTALSLHNIYVKSPKNIYQTIIQWNNNPPDKKVMEQATIDKVFEKQQRQPSLPFIWKDYHIYQSHRKIYDKGGIIKHKKLKTIFYTDLERTMVDITVRPGYAGGVEQVLEAFKQTKHILNIENLLKRLDAEFYIYPYQQLIGFYLQHAGYPDSQLKQFKKLQSSYRFYLDYAITNPVLDNTWNIFFPKELA